MKIVTSVILASAFVISAVISAISLSGCAETANSQAAQPTQGAAPANHWGANIGQQCTIWFTTKEGSQSAEGTLKSAHESWIVVGNVMRLSAIDKSGYVRSEYHIPTSSVSLLIFPEKQGRK